MQPGDGGHWETSDRQLISAAREIVQLRLSAGPATGSEWVVQYLAAYGVLILPAGTPLTYALDATSQNLVGAGANGFAIVNVADPLETLAQSQNTDGGYNALALGIPILTMIGGVSDGHVHGHPFGAAPIWMPAGGLVIKSQQTVQFRFAPFSATATPGPQAGSYATMAAYVVPRSEQGR